MPFYLLRLKTVESREAQNTGSHCGLSKDLKAERSSLNVREGVKGGLVELTDVSYNS